MCDIPDSSNDIIRDEERLLMTTIVMKNKIWDQSVIFFTRSGILNYLYTTDAKDRNGNTPLHLAIEKSKFDIAKEIIHLRPALAKEKNKLGHTPMHICALKVIFQLHWS